MSRRDTGILSSRRPRAAVADGTADEADLQFRLGKEEFKKGSYDAALAHFFASNRLAPNRNVLFNIANTYEAEQRYADAHRYYVDAGAGETNEKKKADVTSALAFLAPHVAVLDVVTDPPGATLYIGRKDLGSVGKSPRPLAVSPGKYQVVAELEGYEAATTGEVEVLLGKQTKVSLSLTRIIGTVKVEVKGAPKAAVRVDDENGPVACTAPCDLTLSPGRHELHFAAEGFQAAPRLVLVEAKKTTSATGTLVPLTGTIVVRADERDAVVKIDGKPLGFTPAVLQGVPVGERKVDVELPGYRPYRTTVLVTNNQQIELTDLVLTPIRDVTAVSRTAENIDDAPSSVTIIDRRELDAFGYPTLAEALRGVRGVTLSNDRAYASAQVRGIGQPNDYGNRLLVMSDGQSLNDNLLNSSYIGSDGRVDLHDVSRIEIVRGPGSLLYGTGAFSGVVNLVTQPIDSKNAVHGEMGVYDNKVIHGRAGFHYNFAPDKGIWGSVQVGSSEGFDVSINEVGNPPNRPTTVHGVEKFTNVGTQGRAYVGSLTAQWSYHQRDQIAPAGAYGTVTNDPHTRLLDRRFMTELRFEPKINDKLQIFARAHANHYSFHADYRFEDGDSSEDFAGTWFGVEARAAITPLPWLRLTAGGEGQFHIEATMTGDSLYRDGTTENYMNERRPFQFGAGYALIDGSPAPWFRFSAGARVDVYSTFGPIVVPRGALIFHPGAGHTLKLMGGRAFRAPSIYEQFYSDGGTTELPAVDATHELGPESVVSGEIEYSVRFLQDWVALAAVHTSYVEGTIVDRPGRVERPSGALPLREQHLSGPRRRRRGGDPARVAPRHPARGLVRLPAGSRARLHPREPHPRERPRAPRLGARFVVPAIKDIASLGFRATLESPRRIDAVTNDRTDFALVADATISGKVRELGLRYVMGIYNIADRKYQIPVADTFTSRTMPQNGRTFLIDVILWQWP